MLVRGHIANREAIHMALDAGIDVIDHGDGMDAMAIERMVELGTFLVPSQLFPVRFAEMMGGGGLGFTAAMAEDIERALAILPKANEAGVKLLCGDDYGAISLPHGRYADELEFYVKEAGIPPLDVIRWATRNGAELMGRSHELGSVREGYLADLLVVDGDPLADIALLQDQATAAGRHEGRHARAGRPRSPRRRLRTPLPSLGMIIIAGSLSFDPSDRDDVLASLAEVTEASRRDAGCLEYFWGEDLEAPTRSASSSAGSHRSCSTPTSPSRTRWPSASATCTASRARPPASSTPRPPRRACLRPAEHDGNPGAAPGSQSHCGAK